MCSVEFTPLNEVNYVKLQFYQYTKSSHSKTLFRPTVNYSPETTEEILVAEQNKLIFIVLNETQKMSIERALLKMYTISGW